MSTPAPVVGPAAAGRPTPSGAPTARARAVVVVGVLLVAANLRPSLTSVGPVLPALRADLGLSATAAGAVSALPLLVFAASSPLAPRLARWVGPEVAVAGALVVLAAGTVLRSLGGGLALFAGTVVLAAGIGTANVLLPVVVKVALPDRVGAVTSWYAAMLTVAAALASGLAAPIAAASSGGWRTATGCWALLAVVAAAAWLPVLRRARTRRPHGGGGQGGLSGAPAGRVRSPWGSPLAWQVAAFMALQSLGFYSVATWLPSILADEGVPASAAGAHLVAYQLAGLVSGLLVPLALRGRRDQRGLGVVSAVLCGAGYLGLVLAPAAAWVWASCAGLGAGVAFTLALTLIALRSAGPAAAGPLSAMVQCTGYLVAAAGPVALGAVHDATGRWTAPLLLLTATTVALALSALGAGRDLLVHAPAEVGHQR